MSDDDPAPLYPRDPPDGTLLADLSRLLGDLGKALGGAVVRHLPRRRP